MNDTSDPIGDTRRGIQSIEIGLRVLAVLRDAGRPCSLKNIARGAGLPASNCHRYLVSFMRAGFVAQDARTGRYDLGAELVRAGLAALGRVDAMDVAMDAMERIVDETGHSGHVVLWADAGPTIVRWFHGRHAVRTSLAAGSTLPLLTSATGRIFLAFLPPRQTAALAAIEVEAGAADPAGLTDRVRADGLAEASGDHIPGLAAIAAPVLDVFGEAASVLALVSTMQRPFTAAASAALRDHATRASNRLGWSKPTGLRAVS